MKIVEARINKNQPNTQNPFGDPNYGRAQVIVTLENGREEEAFSYYIDELYFTPQQFIGKTLDEARRIRHDADVTYLRT